MFIGCGIGVGVNKDDISNSSSKISSTRFTTTEDSYAINGLKYKIVVDTQTDNVYLSTKGGYSNGSTFPLLDKDGKPVKYKDLKSK